MVYSEHQQPLPHPFIFSVKKVGSRETD